MKTNVTPLISIIVPVYNAEAYISSCIESIQKQSYSHFELLLIDDGSSDNSGSICHQYAKGDSRIKYFKKENQGVSHTRNFGIQNSSGLYIAFIDADDMITPNYLEKLYSQIDSSNKTMISMCKYSILSSKITERAEVLPSFSIQYDSLYDRYLEKIITRKIFGSCWRILFPAQIIRDYNIQFTPCKIAEDQLFLIEVLLHCNQINVCNEHLYLYRQVQASVSHSNYISNYLDDRQIFIKKLNQILSQYPLEEEKYQWLMAYSFQFYRMLLYMNATASKNPKLEIIKLDKSIFSSSIQVPKKFQKKFLSLISKKHHVLYLLIKFRLFFFIKYLRKN